jgi:taurine dioxygenase
MENARFGITPAGGGAGAYVQGVDISKRVPKRQIDKIRAALGEYGVVFLREQAATPEQHIGFAQRFSDININRFFASVKDHPQIAEVRKEPEQHNNIGGAWHTDHSYDKEPAMGSILFARETPPSGGDTLFASMFAAYETLSPGLQKCLRGLKARHTSRFAFGNVTRIAEQGLKGRYNNPDKANQDAVHPVVIRHPISGRRALYVNPAFTIGIQGWTDDESKPFLEMLYKHAARPEHTYRFKWATGSIAFWDNRATWHYAVNDYPGQRRVMHRITLEGCKLAA